MIKHKDSHLDHDLTPAQVDYLFTRFADRSAFFLETIELPLELGTVPCGLYGPIMGDPPVAEEHVTYQKRGERQYNSRVFRHHHHPLGEGPQASARRVRTVTVIAGPHDGHPCVLFTAFGGPATPQEPDDPNCKDREASQKFWAQHALAV